MTLMHADTPILEYSDSDFDADDCGSVVVPSVSLLFMHLLGWGAKFGPDGLSIIGSPSGKPE